MAFLLVAGRFIGLTGLTGPPVCVAASPGASLPLSPSVDVEETIRLDDAELTDFGMGGKPPEASRLLPTTGGFDALYISEAF